MKFGLFLNQGADYAGAPIHEDLVAQVQAMDALGYDCAIIGERHQRKDGFVEPLTTATWLLAKTSRLRIGTGGFIVALHDPYRLAEQTANLDRLSGGRFVCGVVLGYFAGDFDPLRVPLKERVGRFSEGLEIMRRLWTGERVTYRGRYYTLDDVFISPTPLQQSGPPIWVGAKVEAAIRRAAALGDGWFPSANDDLATLRSKIAIYREALRAGGKADGEIILMRDGFVAESLQEARRIAEQPMLGLFNEYHAWKAASPDSDRYDASFEGAIPKLLLGSPQQVVDQIGPYAEAGVTTILLRCTYPGLPQVEAMRCIERFGRDVIPLFAKG